MKKILYILLLVTTVSNAQMGFSLFRFATFYASASTAAPFSESQAFMVDGVAGSGYLVETTEVNAPNYNITVGLRKIARFDYQVKKGNFYTGSEDESSDYATVSNAPGLEYLFRYSSIRNRGMKFKQQEYKVRYISDRYTAKASYVDDGLINLKYTLGEFRLRKNFGNVDLTLGVSHRSHPVYGFSPVAEWFSKPENKHWWQLANVFGYSDDDNHVWSQDGEVVAESDHEFYSYHFGDAVNRYNRQQLNDLGLQQEISMVVGVDYYLYSGQSWVHAWGSVYPIHKGLSEYSYSYPGMETEWDIGVVFGVKFNKHFSIFVEGRHLKYWDIRSYNMQTGINYLIF